MISIKDTKHLLFKYKYVIFLLIVTVFFLFYNNSIEEDFENTDERNAIYQSALGQIRNDLGELGHKLKKGLTDYHNNVLHGNVPVSNA